MPLPAGAKQKKSKKNALVALVLLLVLIGAAAYFLCVSQRQSESTSAFLSGSFIEIRVLSAGKIDYIAKTGQPVQAGEVVLRVDSSEHERAAKEAEAVVSSQAANVPMRSRELMLRYLAIAQSENELAEAIQQAMIQEKSSQEALADFTGRQAAFSLELRKLELKHNRLREEEERMEAMRVEEELLRKNLEATKEQFEAASLERAAAEKRLQAKRDLGRALRSLPGQQREQLYALETEFYKMYEAEHKIALSGVTSPKSGKVFYTALSDGDNAKEGDTGLYIIPHGKLDIWVKAYFSPNDARKMQPGSPCTISFGREQGATLEGTLTERLPYVESGQAGDIPFKIALEGLNDASLAGLAPGQPMRVKVGQSR